MNNNSKIKLINRLEIYWALPAQVDSDTFERFVEKINQYYAEAEGIGCSTYLQGCFACLTAHTALLCMQTQYDKNLKRCTEYIKEQNIGIFLPKGLKVIDPFERGLRVIEILVLPVSQSHMDEEKWSKF
ncbi:putative golgin subfamily A member 7 [Apostichopus japonicus]|uniref:Ras modification protein ERF4 n=1 Tax=Stichopus japonicus TaxID=307972 RepID=A0A2G8LNZ5_STIJA|nr:putative golgin subfamily A member 7 [Apostichopus japonicus]